MKSWGNARLQRLQIGGDVAISAFRVEEYLGNETLTLAEHLSGSCLSFAALLKDRPV